MSSPAGPKRKRKLVGATQSSYYGYYREPEHSLPDEGELRRLLRLLSGAPLDDYGKLPEHNNTILDETDLRERQFNRSSILNDGRVMILIELDRDYDPYRFSISGPSPKAAHATLMRIVIPEK